jgi:hypothetical protein
MGKQGDFNKKTAEIPFRISAVLQSGAVQFNDA